MKYRRRLQNTTVVIAGMLLSVFLLTKCIDKEDKKKEEKKPVAAEDFAGSASCANCHKAIYDTHIHTPHFNTSSPASEKNILGSFLEGKNLFNYDSGMAVKMEKRDSGLYQVGYYFGEEKIVQRFDIVVGSGAKGQTYLYRYGNYLVQLPVSFFTAANQWANSPQYPTFPVLFNRPITSRCLECHTTYARKISPPANKLEQFDSTSFIYGIDCEKCHGPASKHVEFQTQNPKATNAKFIISPASFTREQKLDLCALCHGGPLKKTTQSFTFTAGDRLTDFFKMDTTVVNPDSIDVHGNQYGLLRSSKCFRMSNMTCTTCHNPHQNERGKDELFSQKCATCHTAGHDPVCKLTSTMGTEIDNNCINCHMPKLKSHSITELVKGEKEPTAAVIRSHYIAIYPAETKAYIDNLRKNKKSK